MIHLYKTNLPSANILENPKTRTTGTAILPPAAPATMANEVSIPSKPPNIKGFKKPPSV